MTINVILSEQDLAEFLEDNQQHMEAYRSELQKRLSQYFNDATVEIDKNMLTDSIDINGEPDTDGIVSHIMNKMVNDWEWLI